MDLINLPIEVGELKTVLDLNLEKSPNCDCSDPGTGGDTCRCEDS